MKSVIVRYDLRITPKLEVIIAKRINSSHLSLDSIFAGEDLDYGYFAVSSSSPKGFSDKKLEQVFGLKLEGGEPLYMIERRYQEVEGARNKLASLAEQGKIEL